MTLFGPDISSYQHGLALSQVAPCDFVLAKVTEGTYYTDPDYDRWRWDATVTLGKPFVWYHFLSGEDPAAQVSHLKSKVADPSLPGMLDFEPTASYRPTFAQLLAFADAALAAGLHLRLVYLPHWYWQQIGEPSLLPLVQRGLLLVSSSYPGGSGVPAALYPGDGAGGWQSYGGMTPSFYQYTDQASSGGQKLDYNAFRGTAEQLAAVLGSHSLQGAFMSLTDEEQARVFQASINLYSLGFYGGPSCGETPPGGANNSLVSKLDYLIDQAKKAVDLNALAAALAPLLHPTTDVAALAQALAPHLPGGVDPAAVGDALAAHFRVV